MWTKNFILVKNGCYTILSCTQKQFHLADGVSVESANIDLRQGGTTSDKAHHQTCSPCLYYLILLVGIVPFVVLNNNFISCNNICCTTRRC
jgi:hypothetical protein